MSTEMKDPTPLDAVEELKFWVNGEEVVIEYRKDPNRRGYILTAGKILAAAGFGPVEDWVLSRDSDGERFNSPDDEVIFEPGDRFTATFRGPTPVS